MGEPTTPKAARTVFASALRDFGPAMPDQTSADAVRGAADIIDACVADISTRDAAITGLRAQVDRLTEVRDELRRFSIAPFQYGRLEGIAIGLRSGGDPAKASEMILAILNKTGEVSSE